jgi:hypothetical protein
MEGFQQQAVERDGAKREAMPHGRGDALETAVSAPFRAT